MIQLEGWNLSTPLSWYISDGLQDFDCIVWFVVYNQDNRYKVAQDEEKARKKSAAEKKRQEDGQRQNRRNLLVKRAGGKVSVVEIGY